MVSHEQAFSDDDDEEEVVKAVLSKDTLFLGSSSDGAALPLVISWMATMLTMGASDILSQRPAGEN